MMIYQTNEQWQRVKARAKKRELNPLPTIVQGKAMMDSCGYDFEGMLCRGRYVFRDRSGQRPLHIRTMTWTLGELRHAVRYGW